MWHRLRGTIVTRLFEGGYRNSSVASQSGHRDHRCFFAHQNLFGFLGAQQQDGMLGTGHNAHRSGGGSTSVVELSNSMPNSRNFTASRVSTTASNPSPGILGSSLFLSHISVISGNIIVNRNYGNESK